MKVFIVCVKDRALNAFSRPAPVVSLGVAIRAFQDMVNGGDAEMAKHPEDYELYHLGWFDDDTGRFENVESPVQLALGDRLVNK